MTLWFERAGSHAEQQQQRLLDESRSYVAWEASKPKSGFPKRPTGGHLMPGCKRTWRSWCLQVALGYCFLIYTYSDESSSNCTPIASLASSLPSGRLTPYMNGMFLAAKRVISARQAPMPRLEVFKTDALLKVLVSNRAVRAITLGGLK